MTTKLTINFEDLLRQRTGEGERTKYKAGWNPDAIDRTLNGFTNDFYSSSKQHYRLTDKGRQWLKEGGTAQ